MAASFWMTTPYRHKRNDAQVLQMLAVKESGSDSDKLVQAVAEYGTGSCRCRSSPTG